MSRHDTTNTSFDSTDTVRTRRGSVRLADKVVRSLKAPPKGSKITYDTRLSGFGVRVTSTGRKAFVLNYRLHGRERRITIGSYPEWTLLAARKRAEELRRDIDIGKDPLQQKEDLRREPRVSDLCERYMREHLPKKSSASTTNDLQMWTKDILPNLGPRRVSDVSYSDIDALHRKVSKRAPIQANRIVALLRKAFNLAVRWGWTQKNPATGIQMNPETKRTRYLSEEEIGRLLSVLDDLPSRVSCDAIKFMLLTGCRRGEALQATWEQFDHDMKVWTKPASATKQRKFHRVPVSSAVTDLLRHRKSGSTSPFVFPSHTGNALTDIKKTWARVREEAHLQDVRLHDLRHTFASLLASNGQSLPIIGAMLGHTQTQTTARYAHLFDEPLLNAAEIVAASVPMRQAETKNATTRQVERSV